MAKDTVEIESGAINLEGIKLIARLGAADPKVLKHAIEDYRLDRFPGRWTKYDLINYIIACLSDSTLDDCRRMESALISHALWAGAKRH